MLLIGNIGVLCGRWVCRVSFLLLLMFSFSLVHANPIIVVCIVIYFYVTFLIAYYLIDCVSV
jgi:hypothetical protein